MGLAALLMAACANSRQVLQPEEVIQLVLRNECQDSGLDNSPMLLTLWSAEDTVYIPYRQPDSLQIEPGTPVQLGALTASFLVPGILERMENAGLTMESVAIPVRKPDGSFVRDITYGQLLQHHSDLPVFEPTPEGSLLDQLLMMNELLENQNPAEWRSRYRYDNWNYALAIAALQSSYPERIDLRNERIEYADQLPDSIRAALLSSVAKPIPNEAQRADLFAVSTGGVADTYTLIGLLDS